MATTLLTLPREIRDEIIRQLFLPGYVYTSSAKPNTTKMHLGNQDAATYIDTRIYLPYRIPPNILGVCRQIRHECLHYYAITLHSLPPKALALPEEPETPFSNVLAKRIRKETDEKIERMDEHGWRITLEVQRGQKGQFGYFQPIREELSPRFLVLLPLTSHVKRLRLVVWAGFDWWWGSRPRVLKRVNGRLKLEVGDADTTKSDAVSIGIERVLEKLPALEQLSVELMVYAIEFSRWDLPEQKWANIQYWLDAPIKGGERLKKVSRRLVAAWKYSSAEAADAEEEEYLTEAFYVQEEERLGEKKWRVHRKGGFYTPTVLALADSDELPEPEVVDEAFERED